MPGRKPTAAQQAAREKAQQDTLWYLAKRGNRKAKRALASQVKVGKRGNGRAA